jgi:hypothetical protein
MKKLNMKRAQPIDELMRAMTAQTMSKYKEVNKKRLTSRRTDDKKHKTNNKPAEKHRTQLAQMYKQSDMGGSTHHRRDKHARQVNRRR